MKLRAKMLKKMISVVCAVSMLGSFIGSSVSAVNAPANASVDVVNGINALNNILDQYRESLDIIINNVSNLTKNPDNNEEIQLKLVQAMSKLEGSKEYIQKLDNAVIGDFDFISGITHMLEDLLMDVLDLSNKSKDINQVDWLYNCSDEVQVQLENINNEIIEKANNNNNNNNINNINNNNHFVSYGEAFNKKLDSIHNNSDMNLDEKFKKELELLTEVCPDECIGRAEGALNIIKRYNYDGEKRKTIIDTYVVPVLSVEAKKSFDKCCNAGGTLFVEQLKQHVTLNDVETSLNAVNNSNLNDFYELFDLVCDGPDGFYKKMDEVKKNCYQQYVNNYDKRWCPVIVDLVKANRLASRLESMAINSSVSGDAIRHVSKTFNKIFSYREGDEFFEVLDEEPGFYDINPNIPEGMYGYLTGSLYKNDIKQPEGNYIGQYPVLHDFYGKFQSLIDVLVTGREDNESDVEFQQKVYQILEVYKTASVNVNNRFTDNGGNNGNNNDGGNNGNNNDGGNNGNNNDGGNNGNNNDGGNNGNNNDGGNNGNNNDGGNNDDDTDDSTDDNNDDNNNHGGNNDDNGDDNVNWVEHDAALRQRVQEIWNQDGKNADAKGNETIELLLQDPFMNKKQGADFILEIIDNIDIKIFYNSDLLEDLFVMPVVREEVYKVYKPYRDHGGELFVAELENRIGENGIDRHMKYARSYMMTVDAWTNRVFDSHFEDGEIIDGLGEEINTIKKECYNRFRNTGDVRWSPLSGDLARLDTLISEAEADKNLQKMEQFCGTQEYKKFSSDVSNWFSNDENRWDGEIQGIYPTLTGHYYTDDFADDQKEYIGQYPILHNLHDKMVDLINAYSFNVAGLTIEQFVDRVHHVTEDVREASRQVKAFFDNNNNGAGNNDNDNNMLVEHA